MKEFRIVILFEFIFCYEKVLKGDEWHFIWRNYKYLDPVGKACYEASKALEINYVGFDVLMNENNEFVILEANSGPIITDEVIDAFKKIIL